MSEKVKLIIEITKEHYEATKKLDKKYPYMLAGGETAIAHGTPLDDVKTEIDKAQEPYMTSKDYDEGVRFGLMLACQIVKAQGRK